MKWWSVMKESTKMQIKRQIKCFKLMFYINFIYTFRKHFDDSQDQVHTNRSNSPNRNGTQTVPHQNLHGDYFKPQPRVK